MAPRPEAPWTPANFRVFGIKRRTSPRRITQASGEGAVDTSAPRTVYDVRYRADSFDFRYRFEQKGWAETFVRQLHAGFAKGWPLDPQSRRFIDPTGDIHETADEDELTVYEHFRDYIARKWRTWAPSSRQIAQADLARACLHLIKDHAPQLTPDQHQSAVAYLRSTTLMPGAASTPDCPGRWDAWFRQWSLPLSAVTDDDLQAFIDDVAHYGPDGHARKLAPSSLARTKAVVQGAFTYAVKRRLIDWNPWAPVHINATDDQQRIDSDLVMDPAQVMAIAHACAHIDPRYFAYVLIQGLCGLRPGEAGELRRHDIHPRRGTPQTLRLRASRTTASDRYILDHESRRRPLKGHGERFTRSVPILARFAPVLHHHLNEFVGPDPDTRVFTTATGQPIHPSNFQRDVWRPAREAVFAIDHPLRGARRHDLRHSAITAWLNAGVPLKTAQAWSGHQTLSVLLDTYAGVLESDELVAQQRFDSLLDHFYNKGSVTPR